MPSESESPFSRYLRLEREFLARPDQRVREVAMAVAYAREVLKWNRDELCAALESTSTTRELGLDVSVRIHNFAASAYSLSNAVKRALPAAERQRVLDAEQFDDQVAASFRSDLACFILALRDYCQHFRNPTEFTFGWSQDQLPGGPERRLRLKPEPLLLYLRSRRGAAKQAAVAAARYVEHCGLSVDIWDAVQLFGDALVTFDGWFDGWYRRAYQSQIDALDEAETLVAYAFLAWRFDDWSLDRNGYPGHLLEGILKRDIGLDSVAVMLGDPAAAVIDELNAHHLVDPELEHLIRQAFDTWAVETGWAAERARRAAESQLDAGSVEQAHQADAQGRIVD